MHVPNLDQPQVNQAGLPDARVQLDYRGTHGEAVAQGLQQLGQGGEQAATHVDRALDLAAEVEATNAHTQFVHDATSALHGTSVEAQRTQAAQLAGVPGSGAAATTGAQGADAPPATEKPSEIPAEGQLNAQGLNAVAGSGHTLEYLSKRRDDIASGLSARARQRFMQSSGPQLEAYRASIEDHTHQQIQVVAQESLKATMAAGLSTVVNSYDNDHIAYAAIQGATQRMEQTLRARGLPADAIKEHIDAYREEANEKRLQKFVDLKDSAGASKLYDVVKDELPPESKIGKHVEDLRLEHQASVTANALVDGAKDPEGGLYDPAKALSGYLVLPPEKRTDKAREFLTEQLRVAEANNRALATNHWKSARTALEKGGLAAVPTADVDWMRDHDPDSYAAFQKLTAERRLATKSKPSPAEQDALFKVQDHMRRYPEDFSNIPPDEFEKSLIVAGVPESLAPRAMAQFLQIQGKPPNSDKTLPAPLNNSVLKAVNGAYPNQRGPADKDSGERGRAYMAAYDNVMDKTATFKMAHPGKLPTTEQAEAWAAEAIHPVAVKGRLYGTTNVPLSEYRQNSKYQDAGTPETVGQSGGDLFGAEVAQRTAKVPYDLDQQIRQGWQAKYGRPASDSEVRAAYDRALTKQAEAQRQARPAAPPAAPRQPEKPAPAKGPSSFSHAAAKLDLITPVVRKILGPPSTTTASPYMGSQGLAPVDFGIAPPGRVER